MHYHKYLLWGFLLLQNFTLGRCLNTFPAPGGKNKAVALWQTQQMRSDPGLGGRYVLLFVREMVRLRSKVSVVRAAANSVYCWPGNDLASKLLQSGPQMANSKFCWPSRTNRVETLKRHDEGEEGEERYTGILFGLFWMMPTEFFTRYTVNTSGSYRDVFLMEWNPEMLTDKTARRKIRKDEKAKISK